MNPSSPSSGGPNWLLGVDKLTAPTLEYLGFKLRDSVRIYLNAKVRERLLQKQFERDYFIRKAELLYYSADQFASGFPTVHDTMVERTMHRFEAYVVKLAAESQISHVRVLEVACAGLLMKEIDLTSASELGLYHLAGAIMDTLVSSNSVQLIFHLCFVPSVVHKQNPSVTDSEIDELMQKEDTMEQIEKELTVPNDGICNHIIGIIATAYGVEWTPKSEEEEEKK